MSQANWFQDVLGELNGLSEEVFGKLARENFTYNPLYGVGVSSKSSSSYNSVFGKSRVRRFIKYSRNLRKFHWISRPYKKFQAKLPADSIIFFREDKLGCIVVSPARDAVLKIFFGKTHFGLLDEESTNLKKFAGSKLEAFIPKLKLEGISPKGARWLVTSFRANDLSLTLRDDPDTFMLENYGKLLLPALSEFYLLAGPQVLPLQEWLAKNENRIHSHPSREKLTELLNYLKNETDQFPQYQVITSNIHNDLHSRNVLMSEKDFTIIDWEGAISGALTIDLIDLIRRYLKEANLFHQFSHFLKGSAELPPVVKEALRTYQDWSREKLNANVPAEAAKISLALYALERSLILFEKKGADRMNDKRGFEARIYQGLIQKA